MKLVKKLVGVVLTKPYLDALEKLVGAGVYASRREIFTDALRRLFRHYEIEVLGSREASSTRGGGAETAKMEFEGMAKKINKIE